MREYRGNTAVAYQPEPQQKVTAQRERKPAYGLPPGEKLLYLVSVIICAALATAVLSLYAKAAEINMKVQQVEQKTAELQETNQALKQQKKQLKSGDRIRQFAENQGMVLAEKNRPKGSGQENVKNRPSMTGGAEGL
ncbi:MAG: cell division protein FtsL [Firmicutes bacterium]|uniref:Cell division protein FtsL n=1 Tax=Melghirimyces thermohalophilus TaxID=1236220 RepID=A0A1G6HQX3_9BACL|nr:cell division protein FtsL [Melghirimyces thermohalophilus]MDA8354409.1 cell division protein FtsL [Bacillota bacterium]SDB96601.1 cell division protein FtsL [Melghirimyces thermohalophilus]